MFSDNSGYPGKNSPKGLYGAVALSFACLSAVMCGRPVEERPENIVEYDGSHVEVRSGDSVVFYWENKDDQVTVDKYSVLYRTLDQATWQVMYDSVPASGKQEVTIYRKNLPAEDSVFRLGLQLKTTDGRTSEIFSSTDVSALPAGGWILLWN